MEQDIDTESRWRAVTHREAAWDGRFLYGVMTTGVYCRPSCPSRRPLRKNVRFYGTAAEAERDGLRACKRCRPTEQPGGAMRGVCAYIEAHSEERLSLAQLAATAGLSRFHLQRTFKAAMGMTPREYQDSFRVARLKEGLRTGTGVADAVYGAGYGSSSRVYERATSRLGMTPGEYRTGGRGLEIGYATLHTAMGPMTIGATDRGICFLQFGAAAADLRREFPLATFMKSEDSRALREWEAAVDGLLRNGRCPIPADVAGTAFQMRVWQFLQDIPRGEVRSYGEVAAGIGRPRAVRAVAQACAANRVAVLIPCHRVVRGDGKGGGYKWGVGRKAALLALEGARV
jgi:AraC family transcriptional regulator of adaptative response/methylated-DNA-[protein]-cysteine methyltransferase